VHGITPRSRLTAEEIGKLYRDAVRELAHAQNVIDGLKQKLTESGILCFGYIFISIKMALKAEGFEQLGNTEHFYLSWFVFGAFIFFPAALRLTIFLKAYAKKTSVQGVCNDAEERMMMALA